MSFFVWLPILSLLFTHSAALRLDMDSLPEKNVNATINLEFEEDPYYVSLEALDNVSEAGLLRGNSYSGYDVIKSIWEDVHAPLPEIPFDNEIEAAFKMFLERHGGKAYILLIGDSTVFGMARLFLSQYKLPGLKFRFVNHPGCFHAARATESEARVLKDWEKLLKPAPDAVLWHFGLHMLHSNPVRSCNPESIFWDCGPYDKLVSDSSAFMAKHVPKARLIWRTTNAVCEDKFTGQYLDNIRQWHDEKTSARLQDKAIKDCPTRYGDGKRKPKDELLDHHSSELQRNTSLQVLKTFPQIHVVDAFSITDNHCEATNYKDGRHYYTLDALVLRRFADALNED